MSLDWKLGVALKSNKCSALNSAFVTVFLKMINANNEVSSHSFEMTIPEFQVRCSVSHVISLCLMPRMQLTMPFCDFSILQSK